MAQSRTFPTEVLLSIVTRSHICEDYSAACKAATWLNDGIEVGPLSLEDPEIGGRIIAKITSQIALPTKLDGVTPENWRQKVADVVSQFGSTISIENKAPPKNLRTFATSVLLSLTTKLRLCKDPAGIADAATWLRGRETNLATARDTRVAREISDKITAQVMLPTRIEGLTGSNIDQKVGEIEAKFGTFITLDNAPTPRDTLVIPTDILLSIATRSNFTLDYAAVVKAATWLNDGVEIGPLSLDDPEIGGRIIAKVVAQTGLPTKIEGVTAQNWRQKVADIESEFGRTMTIERNPVPKSDFDAEMELPVPAM